MAPKHDEIFKRLDDGMLLAWDTTKVDRNRARKIRSISRQQAAALDHIVEGAADRIEESQARPDRVRRTTRSRRQRAA